VERLPELIVIGRHRIIVPGRPAGRFGFVDLGPGTRERLTGAPLMRSIPRPPPPGRWAVDHEIDCRMVV
jgi:hypothetical protein